MITWGRLISKFTTDSDTWLGFIRKERNLVWAPRATPFGGGFRHPDYSTSFATKCRHLSVIISGMNIKVRFSSVSVIGNALRLRRARLWL
jgi:hypothetical protein